MNDLIETIEHNGYKIHIYPDYDCKNPNEFTTPDDFLIYNHSQFYINVEGFDVQEIFEHYNKHTYPLYQGYYIFPVFAYIHGGVVLSLSRSRWGHGMQWDVSFKGFALIRRQKGACNRKQARKAANHLIDVWNDYLSGCYRYILEDREGNEVNSLGGHYNVNDCIADAKDNATTTDMCILRRSWHQEL